MLIRRLFFLFLSVLIKNVHTSLLLWGCMQKHKSKRMNGGWKDGNWHLNPLCVYSKAMQGDTRSAAQHEDVKTPDLCGIHMLPCNTTERNLHLLPGIAAKSCIHKAARQVQRENISNQPGCSRLDLFQWVICSFFKPWSLYRSLVWHGKPAVVLDISRSFKCQRLAGTTSHLKIFARWFRLIYNWLFF